MSRKSTPIEQVLEFNAAYEKSGKSMAAFALQSGLSLHTAQWYRSRAKKHFSCAEFGDADGFSIVPDLPMAETGIELHVSGVNISLEAGFSSSTLRQVLLVLDQKSQVAGVR